MDRLMKTYTGRLLFLFMMIFHCTTVASAQTSTVLPLQPEKLNYAREVEQEAISKKDTLLMAEAYYLYGKVYLAARDYLKSKNYFMKSLRIVEQRGRFDKVSRIYIQLAKLEIVQSNKTKALENAHLALFYAHNGSKRQIIAAYQTIGNAYVVICHDSLANNRKHPLQDSLFYYCNLCERMAYELKDTLNMAAVSIDLGDVYRFQRNPKAFQYYQTALELYKALGHKYNQARMIQQLGLTYLRFNQPDKGYTLLQESEKRYKALQIREFYNEKIFAEAYMEYFQQKRDWQNAFEQSLQVQNYTYNQLIADRDGAVSRLSVEFETEKKEVLLKSQQRELALGQQNQRTQRQFLVVLSVLLLGTLVASTAFYRISRKNQRLSGRNAALVQEQNHRVKNNLQLVSSLLSLQSNRLTDESAKNAVEDSQRRIEVMSLLQRKLYDGDALVTVPVANFVQELTEMVLETFEMKPIETVYQIPATLQLSADYAMRVGLIVNELVTNSCKYAFPGHPGPVLRIAATLEKNRFRLRVTNNGKGFMASQSPSKSFGMRLIQIQVEQLYGTYQFDNQNGMSFEMTFNLIPPSSTWS
jgi:two-component sensor histidine kinase